MVTQIPDKQAAEILERLERMRYEVRGIRVRITDLETAAQDRRPVKTGR